MFLVFNIISCACLTLCHIADFRPGFLSVRVIICLSYSYCNNCLLSIWLSIVLFVCRSVLNCKYFDPMDSLSPVLQHLEFAIHTSACGIWNSFSFTNYLHTVCPGSSDPFYVISYYIKWVTTSWTYSRWLYSMHKSYL